MSTIIESGMGLTEKILFGFIMLLMIPLFLALTQPAWRGQQMIAQMKADCAKQDGVFIKDSGWLTDSYRCAPHLGVREVAQ